MTCRRSNTSIRQDPSCWKTVLPPFVSEAKEVTAVFVTRHLYNNAVSVTMEFVARTDQAKRDFPLASNTSPDYIMCDGRCGKQVRYTDITQFGLCDHNICSQCLAEEFGPARLYGDGSAFCRSAECMKEVTKHLKKDKEKSQAGDGGESSATAIKSALLAAIEADETLEAPSISEDGCTIIIVKYKILFERKSRKMSLCWEQDLLSDTRMSYLVGEVVSALGLVKPGEEDKKTADYYYMAGDKYNKKQLNKFDPKKWEKKKIGRLIGQADSLFVVLDLGGNVGKK